MFSYQFETPAQDKEFLSGNTVTCRAVLKGGDTVSAGTSILVVLSNGKKYKGRIIEFRSFLVQDYLAGDLVIAKT
jgi:hypothetical protein